MKFDRRVFVLVVLALFFWGCERLDEASPSLENRGEGVELNDIHSQLNATEHLAVITPSSLQEIQRAILDAKTKGQFVSISGGKHSMGGQQFGHGTINLSMSSFDEVISLDREAGIVEVQSGIQWPKLMKWLIENQADVEEQWGIRQKQTGADRFSIGGALSSNIHGRGLQMRPMIDDVESFTLIDGNGDIIKCSRTENRELFQLVIGGYGLFGVIGTVKVRLAPVKILERTVQLMDVKGFIPFAKDRIDEGFLYGDFQFAIDSESEDFLKRGICSFYKPVDKVLTADAEFSRISREEWHQLLALAHIDKSRAFDIYSNFYLQTDGQLYRSDSHQMSVYVDDYHSRLNEGGIKGSEMISEIYVPRASLSILFEQLREDFRENGTDVVYGTVRLIEKDTESFLAWAKQSYAAIVFNFHVEHTPEGIENAKVQFRHIIDRALEHDGSYFLTYHRWARKDQVLKAYPQMTEFLRLKKRYDPEERFQSDWYRHYAEMFQDQL